DFFKARDTFEYYKPEIGKPEKFILEAFIDNAFNKPESSNKKIDEVFNGYAQQVNDSGKQQLLEIQQGNYARLYEYEKANGIVKEILDKYSGVLSKDQIEDYKNSQIMWTALSAQPKQEVKVNRLTTITMKRDVAGLANLPVKVGNIEADFIFDTGANISTVTETTAKQFNMKMLDGIIEVGAITGLSVKSQLAVCPEFTIGDITVSTAVFLVSPADALAFPQINYQINGILGVPGIGALEDGEITKEGEVRVPKVPRQHPLRSMALDGLNRVICIDGNDGTFEAGAVGGSRWVKSVDRCQKE